MYHSLSIFYIRSVGIVTSVWTTTIWMIFMMLLTTILSWLRILSILLTTRVSILRWSRSWRRWWSNSIWINSRSSCSSLGMLLTTSTCWWIMGSICKILTWTWSLSFWCLSSRCLISWSNSCIILDWTLVVSWWSLSCSCLSILILTRILVVSWWSLSLSCLILVRKLRIKIWIRIRRTIAIVS